MKYFRMCEFLDSQVAKQKRIVNIFLCSEHIDNVLAMVDDVLDPLRDMFGKAILINSGYRVPELNKAVGGVDDSLHQIGCAVDITAINPIENAHLANLLISNFEFDQLIIYNKGGIIRWLHLSYLPNGNNRHEIIKKSVY